MTMGESGSSWSKDEDKALERALAVYTDEDSYCWQTIVDACPGRTISQVLKRYSVLVRDVMMIESGCVPLPSYGLPEETNGEEVSIQERGNNSKCVDKQKGKAKKKRRGRKGVSWTEDEHRLFLLGLEQYGKGDWRSISRNCVRTRTPTQVASHAQKYFGRLNPKETNKKNIPSIHDTTLQNTQATSQPSLAVPIHGASSISNTHGTSPLNYPMHETPTIWNTQAISQPSLDVPIHGTSSTWNSHGMSSQVPLNHPMHETPTIWNSQATSQPSLDHDLLRYGTPSTWNSQGTSSQPSMNHPMHDTPAMWNAQAALQPSVNVFGYGTPMPTISESMFRPVNLSFGNDHMNHLAPPPMAYGVQQDSAPHYSGPSAPTNMGSIPDNMAYTSQSRFI